MTCSRGTTALFASRCIADEVSSGDAADANAGEEGGGAFWFPAASGESETRESGVAYSRPWAGRQSTVG